MTLKDVDYLLPYHSHIEVSTTLEVLEYLEKQKQLDIKERRTRELLNELEEKGVTKGKCYGKK